MTQPGITFEVNGVTHTVDLPGTTPLMYVLRNDLGHRGVRAGCSIGECGSCRVLIDGTSTQSCLTPISDVAGRHITTPEGLGTPADPHPVQQAFLDAQAGQCGYCVNGMIMTVAAAASQPGEVEDDRGLRGLLDDHLCRCGTQIRMLRAAGTALGLPVGDPVWDREDLPGDEPTGTVAIPDAIRQHPDIADWVELAEDGSVLLKPGKVEIGQGVRTALVQVAAACLGIDPDRVHVLATVTGRSPDEGQTSGSFSIEHGGTAVAMAAKACRRVVVERAARHLDAASGSLTLAADGVRAGEDGAVVAYPTLLADGPITGRIEDTDVPHWGEPGLGAPEHRSDLVPKLTGAPAYVHDLHEDGLLYARVALPPTVDATTDGIDTDDISGMPGIRAVHRDGRFVLVLAEREEQAIRAHGRLVATTRWSLPEPIKERDTDRLLRGLPADRRARREDDGVDAALAAGATVTASFSKPYQAHGPMAGSAAVAVERDGRLHVWSHTQGVYPLREELSALLARPIEDIVVEHMEGPGCYGLTCADDAAAFAAIAAMQVPGTPVRFQFPIEDEFVWDPHGPGMSADLTAAVEDGRIVAWRHHGFSDSHSTRPNGDGDRLMPAWLGSADMPRPRGTLGEPSLRNAEPLYDLGVAEIASSEVRGPLRTGPLRSLGAFFNVFAIESFIDELAEAAGRDPLAFRLDHVTDARAADVLRSLGELVGWQERTGPSGRGLGVALARYKDTKGYAAVAAEVTVDAEAGTVAVDRLTAVCDVGTVVNEDGLRNQLEGGLLQGLSRTLFEELHLADDGIRERDWTTYGRLRFSDVPEVRVKLLSRPGLPPLGAGEVTTPPVPAAVANALDDAIGIRLRTLPINADTLQRRMLDLEPAEMERVVL